MTLQNMKRFLLQTVLIISIAKIAAQTTTYEYQPFVEEGKEWFFGVYGYNEAYGRQYISGDTVISGQPCKIWWQQDYNYLNVTEEQFTAEYLPVYVYEDDKNVKFFFEGETTPRLYFDFGVQVGDTFKVSLPSALRWEHCRRRSESLGYDEYARWWEPLLAIDDITEVEINGRKLRRFTYSFQTEGLRMNPYINDTEKWVHLFPQRNVITEGIGGAVFPHANMNLYNGELYMAVFSCTVGNDTLYSDGSFHNLDSSIIPLARYATRKHSTVIFDLTGRRLAAPPARGLYIQDGKVRVSSGK